MNHFNSTNLIEEGFYQVTIVEDGMTEKKVSDPSLLRFV